jgi:hypothetical protein
MAWAVVRDCMMESTGMDWQPVCNILEGSLEVILVNAQPYEAGCGRKSDVRDCERKHTALLPALAPLFSRNRTSRGSSLMN